MINENPNVFRHPEWKRLYDALVPLLETGRVFTYGELSDLLGIDCATPRGRRHFWRCAKDLAEDRQMQFECVKNIGYRVVQQAENTKRMHNRLGRARKRIKSAVFIGIHTKLDELTIQQRAANADILSRLGRIEATIQTERKEVRKQIVEAERLPHPLLN